jgi:uncharacterized protein YutE (UPF0331/DUF86 family)
MMKRLLVERGKIVNSPKETFRQAGLEELIPDSELWFSFIVIRNLTVHTYEEANAKKVVAAFDSFSDQLTIFLDNIGLPK